MAWRMALFAAALVLAACSGGDPPDTVVVVHDPTAGTTATATGVAPSATPEPSPSPPPPPPTPASEEVTLAAVGDVMLARSIGERVLSSGPGVVFAGVDPVLREADIAVANLETAISDRGTPQPKSYTFRAPPAAAAALSHIGIDVVSLANNHALDYGPEALLDTIALVEAEGVVAAGAGADATAANAPTIVEHNGLSIAFLGYVDTPPEGPGYSADSWAAGEASPGLAWASVEAITASVTAAARQADVVVVMLHAGIEYAYEPSDLQRAYAEAAIDAGAALVLGHHPHVLQPVEEYNGGLIAYSLGNFVFDGFDGDANRSAILSLTLTRNGVESWELLPVSIIDGLPLLDP